jgi:hypothetical protein
MPKLIETYSLEAFNNVLFHKMPPWLCFTNHKTTNVKNQFKFITILAQLIFGMIQLHAQANLKQSERKL